MTLPFTTDDLIATLDNATRLGITADLEQGFVKEVAADLEQSYEMASDEALMHARAMADRVARDGVL